MRVGIANAKIVVRTVDVPPLTDAKQIDAAVRHIAAEELPMPIESAVLDYSAIGMVQTRPPASACASSSSRRAAR